MIQPAAKLVSVIVPVFNCEKYIKKCLESILNQSYCHIEVLVVNDGSTDGSQEIIDTLAKTDSRIQKFQQCNQGVAVARNRALSHATGDYYLFVDGDDYIGVDYVRNLVACAEENQSELVICGYTLVFPHKRMRKVVPGVYIQNRKEEWAYRISSVWGRLYSSTFWKNNDMTFIPEENARAEDVPIDLYANVMARNIHLIKNTEYYYVQRKDSAMHGRNRVLFLFPYIAFGEMYDKVKNTETTNSRAFFDIGVLKFLAQFEFGIYRNASRTEKNTFWKYINDLLKDDFADIQREYENLQHTIELPIPHKIAISLLVKRLGKECQKK